MICYFRVRVKRVAAIAAEALGTAVDKILTRELRTMRAVRCHAYLLLKRTDHGKCPA
jgi:hypothetical protein